MEPQTVDDLRNLTLRDTAVSVKTGNPAIDSKVIENIRKRGRVPFILSFDSSYNGTSGDIFNDGGSYYQFFSIDDVLNRIAENTNSTLFDARNTFGYFLFMYSVAVARAESMASSAVVIPQSVIPVRPRDPDQLHQLLQKLTDEGTSRDTNITLDLLLADDTKQGHEERDIAKNNVAVLISGGTDSIGVAYIERGLGKAISPVQILYGQAARHQESWCVERIAEDLGLGLDMLCRVDMPVLKRFGASGLLRDDVKITEKNKKIEYVPFRNTVFISLGMIHAELTGTPYIAIGANHDDTLAPDGTPSYVEAINAVIESAGWPIRIIAPLLGFGGKPEIIRTGKELGVNFSHTWSCHSYIPPEEVGSKARACGTCGNCSTRYSAFLKLGFEDPIGYKKVPKIRTNWAGPQHNYEALRRTLNIK
ncbi:7-cyano-7-deazaguanine synthase [Candidatus Woesearchaeota archaeon]|nr:7-cyano-7-deazaguanine synthase [Candidatus Woesearchaeota archaeon]